MKTKKVDLLDDIYITNFPCLLVNEQKCVIVATSDNCDYINGVVLFSGNSGYTKFMYLDREFLKKDFKPFYGKIVLSN